MFEETKAQRWRTCPMCLFTTCPSSLQYFTDFNSQGQGRISNLDDCVLATECDFWDGEVFSWTGWMPCVLVWSPRGLALAHGVTISSSIWRDMLPKTKSTMWLLNIFQFCVVPLVSVNFVLQESKTYSVFGSQLCKYKWLEQRENKDHLVPYIFKWTKEMSRLFTKEDL